MSIVVECLQLAESPVHLVLATVATGCLRTHLEQSHCKGVCKKLDRSEGGDNDGRWLQLELRTCSEHYLINRSKTHLCEPIDSSAMHGSDIVAWLVG